MGKVKTQLQLLKVYKQIERLLICIKIEKRSYYVIINNLLKGKL